MPQKANDLASRARMMVILNASSGDRRKQEAAEELRRIAAERNIEIDLELVPGHAIRNAARKAKEGGYQTVIVGGGDGSINTVVSELAGSGVRVGILPLGTFNYFARELGLPLELKEAFSVCTDAHCDQMTLGEVNGQIFLNNASIGLYPQVLSVRERTYKRWGRSRIAAYWSVLQTIARLRVNMRLTLRIGEQVQQLRTPMVFVAKNAYQLREFELPGPECIANDSLTVYVLPSVGRMGLLRLAWKMFRRTVEPFKDFQTFCTPEFVIESHRRKVRVAVDGEIVPMRYPLKFAARPNVLEVLVGKRTGGEAAA